MNMYIYMYMYICSFLTAVLYESDCLCGWIFFLDFFFPRMQRVYIHFLFLERRDHGSVVFKMQCGAVWCSVVQCGAVWCSVVQCGAVCCSVLQCGAVCCSVVQCGAVCCSVVQCVAVCCSVLQCVAVCCSVLQCVAVCDDIHLPYLFGTHEHICILWTTSSLQEYTNVHMNFWAEYTYVHIHIHIHPTFFERLDHGSVVFEMQRFALFCSVLQCVAVCDDLCVLCTPRLFWAPWSW